MRRRARLPAIFAANAAFWSVAWLAWPAGDSLPRYVDLTCGGAYSVPSDGDMQTSRGRLLAATGGDIEKVGPYLADLVAARSGEHPSFGHVVMATHQVALDHGLGLFSAPKRSRLVPPPGSDASSLGYVLRYRADTKWLAGWSGNYQASVRLAVALHGEGDRLALGVDGDQTWRHPFSKERPLPRTEVLCPLVPDEWDDRRVEALLAPVGVDIGDGIAGIASTENDGPPIVPASLTVTNATTL